MYFKNYCYLRNIIFFVYEFAIFNVGQVIFYSYEKLNILFCECKYALKLIQTLYIQIDQSF